MKKPAFRNVLRLIAMLLVITPFGTEAAPARAGSGWTMFRGDAALRGVTTEKLPDKPVLLWSFKTGGPVKSSAVIGMGKVFIGSDDTNVYALNLVTGRKVWAFATSNAVEAPGLYFKGSVFIGSIDGNLYSLDALMVKASRLGLIAASGKSGRWADS